MLPSPVGMVNGLSERVGSRQRVSASRGTVSMGWLFAASTGLGAGRWRGDSGATATLFAVVVDSCPTAYPT